MKQKIAAFHKDEEEQWVADLECGHKQHMRHDPPWMERPWILTKEGRQSKVGVEIECKRCEESAAALGEAVRSALVKIAEEAFEDGGVRGLCVEGRLSLALDNIRAFDLRPVLEEALRRFIDTDTETRLQGTHHRD